MTSLSSTDFRALLMSIQELYESFELARFPERIFSSTSKVIPSHICSYNEIDITRNHVVAVTDAALELDLDLAGAFVRYIGEYPGAHHLINEQWKEPFKLSDLISQNSFRRLNLYNEFYRKLDVEHQLVLPLWHVTGTSACVVWNRDGRDFTERDRAISDLLRPHLVQAHQVAELIARKGIYDGISSAMSTSAEDIAVLSPTGRVMLMTRHARRTIERFFGRFPRFSMELPGRLADWVREELMLRNDSAGIPVRRRPFLRVRNGKQLGIHLLSRKHDHRLLLVLEETEQLPSGVAELTKVGLSRREAQILLWVARGKTNPEIATIIQRSPGTVKKHLDNIYSKLQVSSRAAAVAEAWRILDSVK
jgi:DNA-binding CsgD family transcriptional regulator